MKQLLFRTIQGKNLKYLWEGEKKLKKNPKKLILRFLKQTVRLEHDALLSKADRKAQVL